MHIYSPVRLHEFGQSTVISVRRELHQCLASCLSSGTGSGGGILCYGGFLLLA